MSTEAARSRTPLAAGTVVGNYRIVGPLGAGATGDVYRARDTRLGRDVALKVLLPSHAMDPAARELIEREARVIASLNHPNVIAVYDVGTEGGAMYIVTELVEGDSLRGSTLPLRKALEIAAQIADALAAAHAAGITHRDLKPDNVMVTRNGRVKLLDFGVAKTMRTHPDTDATVSTEVGGLVTGTLSYMAPEQVRAGEVDCRADIFAFGALLHEVLSGTRAFGGDTAADIMAAVLHRDPPELPAAVPSHVRDIVRRCLEKDREQRFQSAPDLAFALRQAAATIAGPASDRAENRPSPSDVRDHVARLTASAHLMNAERLSSLLRFIVEETLEGRASTLKEARIGLEVFGRKPASYDTAIDPIVRVQMGRLRSKLRAYYDGPGATDHVRIEVPIGSYVPSFAVGSAESVLPSRGGPEPPALDDLRIAVLPIVNMSPDSENQYFCDGLTEELINHLAQIPQLRVVARTSSFQFRDAARDIREVGRVLDVSKVLEGSVRKAGTRIRVTVQLINASDGCHLWSDRYEGELTDIFAIHEQIATAVGRSLRLQVLGRTTTPARRSPAHGIEAYNHYLQGRFLWKKRTEQGLRSALEHFERAVTLDPAFARAMSGIADCHSMLGMSGAEPPGHCMPRAAEAAANALGLDDSLAEAHASLAAVRNCYDWDFDAADHGYRRAMALDPSYATTLHWLGIFLHAARGQFAPALDCLEQAIELDPLSPPIIADVGLVHAFREDFDRAAMYCRRALELDPHFHRPFWFLGLSLAWSGDLGGAEEALTRGLDLCPGAAFRARLLGALGLVYAQGGERMSLDGVERELASIRNTAYVPAFEVAQVEMGSGNPAGALACLEEAVADRETYCIFLKSWLTFRPLAAEPRFRSLLAQVGLDS